MNTNTNSTANSNTTATASTNNGGADIGGLNNSVRQILGQQAELLAKIELLIENQNRLELSLRDNLINAAAITGVNSRNQSSASV